MHLYSAFITKRLKGALQWSIYPQRTGSIYRRKLQPLLSSPYMLVLILSTSEGWKAEWTLAGKKVAKYSSLGRTGNGTRDLRVGRQRSYHCANPLLQMIRIYLEQNVLFLKGLNWVCLFSRKTVIWFKNIMLFWRWWRLGPIWVNLNLG